MTYWRSMEGIFCSFENISGVSGVKVSKNNYQKKNHTNKELLFFKAFLSIFQTLSSYFISFCSWAFCNFYFTIIQPWVCAQSFEISTFPFYTFWVFRGWIFTNILSFKMRIQFETLTFWFTSNTSVFNLAFVLVLIVFSFSFLSNFLSFILVISLNGIISVVLCLLSL